MKRWIGFVNLCSSHFTADRLKNCHLSHWRFLCYWQVRSNHATTSTTEKKANVKVPKSALPLMTTWGCFQKWVSPLDFHIKKNNYKNPPKKTKTHSNINIEPSECGVKMSMQSMMLATNHNIYLKVLIRLSIASLCKQPCCWLISVPIICFQCQTTFFRCFATFLILFFLKKNMVLSYICWKLLWFYAMMCTITAFTSEFKSYTKSLPVKKQAEVMRAF